MAATDASVASPSSSTNSACDADLGAAAQDPLEVDGRWGVAPDDDDGQAGRPAVGLGERGDILGDRGPDLVGDRRALQPTGAGIVHRSAEHRRREGLARHAAAHDLARLGGEALDLVEQLVDAGRHDPLELGVADRRQVDQDVGGGTARRGLAEQRGDVEVARGVDVAPAGQCLGGRDQLDAGFDAAQRDLGGVPGGGLERARRAPAAPRPCRGAA